MEEGCSFKWQFFFNILVPITYFFLLKMSVNVGQKQKLYYIPYKFIIHVTPGHLKRHLVREKWSFEWHIFLNIVVPIRNLFLSKYDHEWRSKTKTVLYPYKFISRVMPGHLPKKAFSGRRMQFQMKNLFQY